jgi:hypothetical protein
LQWCRSGSSNLCQWRLDQGKTANSFRLTKTKNLGNFLLFFQHLGYLLKITDFFRIHGSGNGKDLSNPLLELCEQFDVPVMFVGGDSSYIGSELVTIESDSSIGGQAIAQYYQGRLLTHEEKMKGFEEANKLHDDLEDYVDKYVEEHRPDTSIGVAIDTIHKEQGWNPEPFEVARLNWYDLDNLINNF